jgi:hypothetical protein
MPGMQRTHCRHQRDTRTAFARKGDGGTQRGNITDDLHGGAGSDMTGLSLSAC